MHPKTFLVTYAIHAVRVTAALLLVVSLQSVHTQYFVLYIHRKKQPISASTVSKEECDSHGT